MRLDKMLGIKYPFIQGGMANIATGEFAAAVSNAGGLGLIGAGGMNTDMLRENIRKCRTLTDKPFGVNLMLMNPEADAMAELLVEENVKIVTTGAGSWRQRSGRTGRCHRRLPSCLFAGIQAGSRRSRSLRQGC